MSLIEQHNVKANLIQNQLKLKKRNNNINSYEDDNEKNNINDFPLIKDTSNSKNEGIQNKKNKENAVIYPKFIPYKNIKKNGIKLDESGKDLNNDKSIQGNNLNIKRINLNLNLPLEGKEPEFNFSNKYNNIPKINNNNINNNSISETKLILIWNAWWGSEIYSSKESVNQFKKTTVRLQIVE